jgi:isoleucyl-tRNA synthetase
LFLEKLRRDKSIGASLEAEVTVNAAPEAYEFLKTYEGLLPSLVIVSHVELEQHRRHKQGRPGLMILM